MQFPRASLNGALVVALALLTLSACSQDQSPAAPGPLGDGGDGADGDGGAIEASPEGSGPCLGPNTVLDCSGKTACAASSLTVANDPVPPAPSVSSGIVYTGYADPSVRADPTVSGLVHMMYTQFYPQTVGGTTVLTGETHLSSLTGNGGWQASTASPGINGATNAVFPAVSGPDPVGGKSDQGFYVHETPSFTSVQTAQGWRWVSVALVYFLTTQKGNGISLQPATFYLGMTYADTPEHLGPSNYIFDQGTGASNARPEQRFIGNPATSVVRPPPDAALPDGGSLSNSLVSLDTLSGSTCDYWGDPVVFGYQGKLYLGASCRRAGDLPGGVALFATSDFATEPDIQKWSWSFVSQVFSESQAPMLQATVAPYITGAPPDELYQFDLAVSSTGGLLAILNPTRPTGTGTAKTHLGCGFFELDSNFALKQCSGKFVLDAFIENSDPVGSAACGYDRALPEGVLAGRRPEQVSGSLLQTISATGIHP